MTNIWVLVVLSFYFYCYVSPQLFLFLYYSVLYYFTIFSFQNYFCHPRINCLWTVWVVLGSSFKFSCYAFTFYFYNLFLLKLEVSIWIIMLPFCSILSLYVTYYKSLEWILFVEYYNSVKNMCWILFRVTNIALIFPSA